MRAPAVTRGLAILLLGGAILVAGIAVWLTLARPPDPVGLPPAAFTVAAEVGGPWSLVDHRHTRVTDKDFAGRFLLVYFGYTYCPDVCPVELAAMAAAIDALGPLGAKVTPLFITIDPERDTSDKLAQYVPSFHSRLIGLTGGAEEIAAAARAYKVYYRRSGEGEGYLMDHSGFIYFVGPDGKSRAIFRPGAQPADMAKTMRPQLEGG